MFLFYFHCNYFSIVGMHSGSSAETVSPFCTKSLAMNIVLLNLGSRFIPSKEKEKWG